MPKGTVAILLQMYTLKGMNLRIPVPRPIVATFHKHRAAAGRRKVITQLSKVTSSPTLEAQESQCPQEGLFQGYTVSLSNGLIAKIDIPWASGCQQICGSMDDQHDINGK